MAVLIVLVEPQGALNLGAVARVMKNFNLAQLRLVNPRCHPSDGEAQLMAVHAKEILNQAVSYASLPAALADCERVVATVGRLQPLVGTLEPREACAWLAGSPVAALVFGPEDRGLSNEELHHCHHWLTLPTSKEYPSLNLAQAVAICCYLLYQTPVTTPLPQPMLASHSQLEGFYDQLQELLLEIGYLLPHTQVSRMEKFRRLFGRSQLTPEEVTLLRGMVRQMRWATQHPQIF